MQVEWNGEVIDFAVDYGKRKHVKIQIEYPGLVRVLAPKGVDEDRIKALVVKHGDQILKKIKAMGAGPRVLRDKTYNQGELFLYLGKEIALDVHIDPSLDKPKMTIEDKVLRIACKTASIDELKKVTEKFYRKQCRQKIVKRIAHFQPQFKVKPKNIEIVDSNSVWGSCSSERNLRFNWRLMMAPEHVIDYIVVHEMSHLHHMNHSKSFWTMVGKIMPDYEERSKWLAVNGGQMEL